MIQPVRKGSAISGDREPFEIDTEEQHEKDAHPEWRHGKANNPRKADHMINRLVSAQCRKYGEWQCDDDGKNGASDQ
jgi:hypothetical protein